MADIRDLLRDRILILDGGMGTMLQRHSLSGNSEEFNLSRPDIIAKIHSEYVDAGADIITTNSFNASRISQTAYGMQDRAAEFALAAARIARQAADKAPRKVYVAGSVGPTGKSLSLAQDIGDPAVRPYSFDLMADAFEEQIRALLEGGADLLLFETCFDALNTKAAIYALRRIPDSERIPLMISASLSDKSGRTLTGQTMEAFYRSVSHAGPLSFGLNCSLGAGDMIPLIGDVSSWAECAVSCHPNAGLPNEMGEYDEAPEDTASAIREMALGGSVNIVGGCCGTTPDHIRAIAAAVKGLRPRAIPGRKDGTLHVSGLESIAIDRSRNFTNVGERTNVAGSRKFAGLISKGDYEAGLQIAAKQIENGATVIDVNFDDAMLDSSAEMETFLRYISNDPSVAKAALMIDSSHWETILTGLKNAQGKCIVNSISLKEGEEAFLKKAKAIRDLGAAVIVIAFDEEGQATTHERKIRICERAYSLLVDRAGYDPSDIIFDVNVLPVGTGIPEHSRFGADFISAVRWIKENLPGCRTSGGISNLSFAFRGNNRVREAMHSVFLYHAIAAGLDMGIVNPGMLMLYDDIEPELLRCTEDVILDSDPGATDRLTAKAREILQEGQSGSAGTLSQEKENSSLSVTERLVQAVVKGGSDTLEADLLECLAASGKAVDVIDGPLMSGMARVGELFGDGKMFLPQVVKSAKTMKNAVAILQPYIEKEGKSQEVRKPTIVFATVKGDVHDIGKNITAIVMTCNGIEVDDLGVMVPKEDILAEAEKVKADLIGVSGLITPSLFQMEELCREMKSRNMDTPLLVGGAAASALHTAVKLAPLYGHVFYSEDASSSAVLANLLVSDREKTEQAEHEKQAKLVSLYSKSSLSNKNKQLPKGFDKDSYICGMPFPDIPARELGIDEVMPYFDWKLFSAIWGMKGGKDEGEFLKLKNDALREIDRLRLDGGCRISLAARFDACHSEGDDIVCKAFRLPMFRQEGGGRSLADFVPDESLGIESPMGMFAVSVVRTDSAGGCDCPSCSVEYKPMLSRSVRLALAEAASEWLSAQLEALIPEGSGAKISKPAAGYSSCPDHTLKRDILSLLPDGEKLGITLLDSCAMTPDSTICGLIFIHPDAGYPEIRRASSKTIDEYARRRGMSESEKKRFLGHLL
ncbi:MAG: methionine synthase [Candidatus Cryptobacteroides sp.]